MSNQATQQLYRETLFADLYPVHKGTLFEGNHDLCEAAQAFLTICQSLLAEAEHKAAGVIHKPQAPFNDRRQAQMCLADIELRLHRAGWQKIDSAPRRCRVRGLVSRGHCCVLVVLEAYKDRLLQMQTSFADSVLEMPEPEIVVKEKYIDRLVPAVNLFGDGVDVE